MALFKKYLKEIKSQVMIFLLIFILYLVNFMLWHLPMRSLYNSTLFALLVFLLYLTVFYFRFKKRTQLFENLVEENERVTLLLKAHDLANEEFLDLIKVWSHQMKVPIAAIDLLSQTSLAEKELKLELKNQVFALENYLSILLESQRISHLTTDFRFERLSFSDVMKDLLRKYSRFFIQKDLSVELSGDWILISDVKWLTLALEQLLNNAIKYTNSGSIKIFLMNGELRLSDDGIGILPEDLPRLFEHGFTGYNGRIQKKSSGLGLYLTKLIFDKLDFDISVKSQLGVGTAVIVKKTEDKAKDD